MKIYLGNDHGGFELKQDLLQSWNNVITLDSFGNTKPEIKDVGSYTSDSVNYSDLAERVCVDIINDFKSFPKISASEDAYSYNSLGILICGSGQGMAMKANKYPQIRAALCWTEEIARLSREHNNANIICLPGRYINSATALSMVKIFLTTPFAKGRHSARVEKI